MSIDGVVNLFKPNHISSARYVYRLRSLLGERRVGHAGSLDPFADGVLLACVGKATKIVEQLMALPKEYEVGLRLGVTNATFDPEFEMLPVEGATAPHIHEVQSALAGFIGTIMQTPPNFSAVKIEGRSAHRRMRAGQSVSIPPRPVRIDEIELLQYEWPELRLRIACGRGMYVRALARDLGEHLKCGAVCESLKRTRVGPFTADQAIWLRQTTHDEVRAAMHPLESLPDLLADYENSATHPARINPDISPSAPQFA